MKNSRKNRPNDSASMFIGRWQPFHKGHKTLIETVLKQGKPVVIGIRDTKLSKENPYTVSERWTKIQEELVKYNSLVKIITVPDIDEICYGREVGYLIRRIQLDGEVERISGTKIRADNDNRHPIIWITGQSGSGKTTLANALKQKIGGVVLDGDDMRQSISLNAGFSKADREEHNLRVARLAQILSRDNLVIISVIAPFESTRKKINEIIDPTWVYIKKSLPKEKNKPYEIPAQPHLIIDGDDNNLKNKIRKILSLKILEPFKLV